ncbi:MAG: hypothetical protein J5I90_13190 [Caldilineales bacterium]|nr:hypothetical protein [Caldilineales bacterium]
MSTPYFNEGEGYALSKVTMASKEFGDYLEENGIPTTNQHFEIFSLDEQLLGMITDFDNVYQNHRNLHLNNVSMIRLVLALLHYYRAIRRAKEYLDIPENLLNEFQAVIAPYFEYELGFYLPNARDEHDLAVLQEACSEKWTELYR